MMKVLKVAEILPNIESSIAKKSKEKNQLISIRESMNKVIGLDEALKGDIGDAVKEHFTLIHIPVVLLLNQFLNDYKKKLKEISSLIAEYEGEGGLVRQDFIETDISTGIERLEDLAEESIRIVNDEYSKISDIVTSSSISLWSLELHTGTAKKHNHSTVKGLMELDQEGKVKLKSSADELVKISVLVNKVKGWSGKGAVLDNKTVDEINKFFEENKETSKLIDEAIEQSIKDGDSTISGDLAEIVGALSQMNGASAAAKGITAAGILMSGRIKLVHDGNGRFKVVSHPAWRQSNSNKYASKLANALYIVLKKGSNAPLGFIQKKFERYKNAPSNLLREIIGLKSSTTRKGYLGILKDHHRFLAFSEDAVKNYKKFPVDVKATIGQFSNKRAITTVIKKVPYAGIAVSLVTNASEFHNDKNKYKSNWENGGRAAAGIGMDVGVAGLTAGGAAIGSMICPGPGTLIGGAIGAVIGIGSSVALDDKVRSTGEKAGKWAEETEKDIRKNVIKMKNQVLGDIDEGISKADKFITGLFK